MRATILVKLKKGKYKDIINIIFFNTIIFNNTFIGSENANNQLVLAQDINEELIIFLNSEKEINATCIDNQIKIDANFENINDISRQR